MSTVLITGAARGIGAACACLFAQKGFKTAINYRTSEADAVRLCREINMNGGEADIFCADVSVEKEACELIEAVKSRFGSTQVLINNAGIAQQKLFTDITEADFDNMFDCNVKSVFNCCRFVLPDMIHKKYGRIINISSMWGVCGASCEVHYSASKAAVIGLTKALAKEVAPSGITVNCIAPGVIDTPMNSSFDSRVMEELRDETPVGRIGLPSDVARAAEFLSRRDSDFITGQVLGVDGGFI